MKFLNSKEISEEKGNVKVTFKPVTPLNQAALLGYQVDMQKGLTSGDMGVVVQAKMKAVFYALQDMINRLEVAGEIFDPIKVASLADVSDMETIETLNIIFDMVVGLLVEGETKKKSSLPASRTRKR